MNFSMILPYLMATKLTLEWVVGGRTFQISGKDGQAGYWERFFHEGGHPTRNPMTEDQAREQFEAGGAYTLYELYVDQGEKLNREQLFARIGEFFRPAKESDFDKVVLSQEAQAAWKEMTDRVLAGFSLAGTKFSKVEQNVRVETDGSLTVTYRLLVPKKGEVSMSVPPDHWTWRQ